ncbi:SIS domain-containing protein [Pediococcus ethanolidurans]|uniref:Galactosamine 6-phosphate isomerase AgaS n=1 Tax=Pediococcus ethanolidurans TaxID=319653 RepID=A0A0R2K8B9_9LACO|nr:SIS domain-containing protein [Pediococcus ethanolidurans]KRN83573.1 sugar isomerase protein AgaS [Pediococcus ethanolidurans]GEN94072.1 tagatose-6-phosphate ketose [Pediococcus ethanolidurans]SER04061.1 galactosamine 6-phosphate isomerase AgaS [Pediococcus ethanolidurans]
MFSKNDTDLEKIGAVITTREIQQQPVLWQEVWSDFQKNEEKINDFLDEIIRKVNGPVRVLFVGAGSSAYVGDTIVPYLQLNGDRNNFRFEAIDTTKIVSTPFDYLEKNTPTLLVSFARSGNSPESVATVNLAEKIIQNLWQLTISCAPEGQLAKHAENDSNNLVLLQPVRSNDKGFAMTGSFSCMMLTALLVFDVQHTKQQKDNYVNEISKMGSEVFKREQEIQAIVNTDFNRIIYLGSGGLTGLTREAQLKVLELTAGQKETMFDSSMGFHHGPKSFVNNKALVFDFISNNNYTRHYDIDILQEIQNDQIAPVVWGIGVSSQKNFSGEGFTFKNGTDQIPDGYMALPDVVFAQTFALMTSLKVGNTPDTPSATGTVNRVVKGVTIHKLN